MNRCKRALLFTLTLIALLLIYCAALAQDIPAATIAPASTPAPSPEDYVPAWQKKPWVTMVPGVIETDVLEPVLATPVPAEFLFTAEAGDAAGREKYLGDNAYLTRENLPATESWTPPDLSNITADAPVELLLVSIAQKEMGFTEGPKNKNPYSLYLSNHYNAWCSEFVGFCNSQVQLYYGRQVVNTVFPVMTLSDHGMLFFKAAARFVSATQKQVQFYIDAPETLLGKRDYIPQVGDHMWFMWEQSSHITGHTAIVEGVSIDKKGAIWVHTLEGNNNSTTQRRNQRLLADHIYGYGTPVRRVQRVLARNDSGLDVLALKQVLLALGYYQAENGKERVFTDAVKAALIAFQRDQGLETTGKMDNLTYIALEKAYAAR